jgi:hypothetical protein
MWALQLASVLAAGSGAERERAHQNFTTRAWSAAPISSEDAFWPELALPEIHGRQNVGIALSGGGSPGR